MGWRGSCGDAAAGDGAFRRVARALVIKAGFSRLRLACFLWGDVETWRGGEKEMREIWGDVFQITPLKG